MNEKPPSSFKLPKSLANLRKPRTAYSTHPRVQRAFRSLVNLKKLEEQQSAISAKPAEALNDDEQDVSQ
jgi:hypothetical protein